MAAASPFSPNLFAQRLIVGVCDFSVSNDAGVVLSTYALGSCVAVIAYEPHRKVGGIIHFMLPHSTASPERAARHPAMFANTGLPLFFRALAGLKVSTANLRFALTGGAAVLCGTDPFRIGERNADAARSFLVEQSCAWEHEEIGGSHNRAVHLEMRTGEVTVQSPAATTRWSLTAPVLA